MEARSLKLASHSQSQGICRASFFWSLEGRILPSLDSLGYLHTCWFRVLPPSSKPLTVSSGPSASIITHLPLIVLPLFALLCTKWLHWAKLITQDNLLMPEYFIYSHLQSLLSFNAINWIRIFCYCCLVTKLCLTLCNPLDCSPPGSDILWIS